MRNGGLRHPERSALLCFAMFVGGSLSVWLGANEMARMGRETPRSGMLIGLGLFVGIVGFLFMFNFLWGVRLVRAMRRGENILARWTVDPLTLVAFRAVDRERSAEGLSNDYRLPRRTPPEGVTVIFSPDAVLVHDTFFGLSSTGIARFRQVRYVSGNPPVLEFDTRVSMVYNVSHVRMRNVDNVLRIPVSLDAGDAGRRVAGHFQNVIAGRIIVKPDFWPRRIRIGLIVAAVAALTAVAGYSLEAADIDAGITPLIMAVGGVIFSFGGLLLALLAWIINRRQKQG